MKGQLRRTRYLCFEINSKRRFIVSGIAEVIPLPATQTEANAELKPTNPTQPSTTSGLVQAATLPVNSLFVLPSKPNDVFLKLSNRRTRILCRLVVNNHQYTLPGTALVKQIF